MAMPGNREKLLWAALACLRDKGYAHTTARDLVATSGTNLNSIGYHFGSKEALLHEAIAMGFDAWTAEVETAAYERARTAGARMIRRAVEADGMSFSEEHAETLSSLMTAVCDGLILQWLLDPERVPSSEQVMAALAAAIPPFVGRR
jgi:AcrR family transcriptional regulator